MKQQNRESLRIALGEYRNAYRSYINQEQMAKDKEEYGIFEDTSLALRHSYSEWMIAMDVLEETVERILEDER